MTWDEVVRATKVNCRGEVTTAVVDAVLRALIAEGLAIVPREATEAMMDASRVAGATSFAADAPWRAALAAGGLVVTAAPA